MINLSTLKEYQYAEVMGKVVDRDDVHMQSRLRIQIPGFNDKVTNDNLEWIEKMTSSIDNTLDVPILNDIVYVVVTNGEFRWRHMDFIERDCLDQFVGNDDYLKSVVLTYKNLSKFQSNGQLFVGWTDTAGFRIIKDDGKIEVRKDNSILLHDGKKCVHVNGENVSLGSENISKEPGVMGDQNEIALNILNDTVKTFANITNNFMSTLSTAAKQSPYTAHLAPIIQNYGNTALQQISNLHSNNANHFPKTKSTVVSLD